MIQNLLKQNLVCKMIWIICNTANGSNVCYESNMESSLPIIYNLQYPVNVYPLNCHCRTTVLLLVLCRFLWMIKNTEVGMTAAFGGSLDLGRIKGVSRFLYKLQQELPVDNQRKYCCILTQYLSGFLDAISWFICPAEFKETSSGHFYLCKDR